MHYAHYLQTAAEPVGMTPLSPMRFATATGPTYGGEVVTVPAARSSLELPRSRGCPLIRCERADAVAGRHAPDSRL